MAMNQMDIISEEDRSVLRSLAGKVAELAARKTEEEKRDLWTRHNELEETRPLIFCDPEGGWKEIIQADMLACRNDLARGWELRLRKEIFWAQGLKDDRVIEPYFDVAHVYQETDWGMHEQRIGGERGGSFIWDAPLKTYDDLDKLHAPVITVDHQATQQRLELAKSTLGDLLAVRLRTGWWWSLGLTQRAAYLRGLEQLMMDIYDHPDGLKRFMASLRDATLARVNFLESHGLLRSNRGDSYVGSGGFGYTRYPHNSDEPSQTKDMWGFCESQETTGWGPEIFAEFVYPYQLPLLEKFALNCYGCCEPLHSRWNIIAKTPRLRRVSVSAWADVEKMAEQLGDRVIYSYKPPPSDLARPVMDEAHARVVLRRLRNATRGCRLEVIMKDNHTLGGNPRNAIRWIEIAREELGSE
ncbi:MAG: hypothetical protein FWD61_15345 [Phycisphaerales bacterium]|nr:hypothetical protein [Phycisphaerales bacterium]